MNITRPQLKITDAYKKTVTPSIVAAFTDTYEKVSCFTDYCSIYQFLSLIRLKHHPFLGNV